MRKERWTERMKEGREGRAEIGGSNSEGEEKGRSRKGDKEGGTLQGRYPEEETGQYIIQQ